MKEFLMEEYHLTVYVPRGLPDADYARIRKTLSGSRFRHGLRRAIRNVIGRHAGLEKVRVTVTR